MPRAKTGRKALFRAALALAGTTAERWAEGEGVTSGHLSHVLAGKRESATLTEKIDAFIAKHMGKQGALAGRTPGARTWTTPK
jgi:hypothetical protein